MNRTTRRRFLQTGAAGAASLALPIRFTQAAKKGGVMRMGKGHGGTHDSFDPATYENNFTIAMSHGYNIYMTEVTADGTLTGQLAESWEPSADAVTWVFRLRKGVTFHDGRDVTPEDVIASINHHRGEDSKSAAKPIVSPITDMKADGKHAIVFTLDTGNADFPFILSDYHLPVMPSEGGKSDWQSGIGAGAYKVRKFEQGIRIDLDKYADYWNPDRGHFDAIQLLTIADAAARCCFADCLITDFSDYFARWVRGFPTVFGDRRKMGRLAGCRTGVGASRRCAAPALRCGPSGDPPPCARLSASMAVSAAFGHGPIARRIVLAGA